MKSMLQAVIFALLMATAANANAGAYTSWGTVEYIERVSNGLLVKGTFGDPNSCGETDLVFYPSSNPDYEVIVSMALTALTAGKEMRFFSSGCTAVSFHWSQPVINVSASVVFIR